MRKKLASLILVTCFSWSSYATGMDFIVMVDTSESMITHFDDLIPYLFENIINRSRVGDSVHLLAFHNYPELIVAQPVLEESSYDELLKHLILLQPVGPYTNLITASEFLLNYSRSLLTTNQKNIIFITDGIHDPPPDSPLKFTNSAMVTSLINSNINKITEEGWLIKVVKVKPESDQSSAANSELFFNTLKNEIGQNNVISLDSYSQNNNLTDDFQSNEYLVNKTLGLPTLRIKKEIGTVGRRLTLPILIQNHDSEAIIINLKEIKSNNVDLLVKPVTSAIEGLTSTEINAVIKLPQEIKAGSHSLLLKFYFSPDVRIVPRESYINFTLEKNSGKNKLSNKTLIAFLIVFITLCLFIIIFIFLRSFLTGSHLTRTMSYSLKENSKPALNPSVTQEGFPLIEMRVEFQNSRIGNRNIKVIRAGSTLTIGGGVTSSFLIFLYPFPQRIGQITYNGEFYTFNPTLIHYFPQLDSPLENCLGKDIIADNLEGHQVTFKFIEFHPTLDKINALMRSISKPVYQ